MATYQCRGPRLQEAMFEAGITPDAGEIAAVAQQARRLFALSQ